MQTKQGQAIRPTQAGREKVREMHWMMLEMVSAFAPENDNDFERTWDAIAKFANLYNNQKAATLFELVWADYAKAIGLCESGPSGEDAAADRPDGAGDRQTLPTGASVGDEGERTGEAAAAADDGVPGDVAN
jgi:hypothetical protein